jgi:diguanylate cyclase (GGDEF)-like protein
VLALRENATLLHRLDDSLLEARGLQEQLRHQATHDALTGLANRALFDERLDAVTGPAAVLLVDLDGFKSINDTHGHHAGDVILTAVADRLRRCVPASATAARLGGDEFAVLLPGADEPTARLLVDRFTALLDEPVAVDGVVLRAEASIGVAAGTVSAGPRPRPCSARPTRRCTPASTGPGSWPDPVRNPRCDNGLRRR